MKQVDYGIFLYRTPYSDSSLITTFYTKKYGLKKFLFKGGKKKSYNLFPLSISELSFYGRQESNLLNLTLATPAVSQTIQFDPIKSTIAFFIAEVIQKCTHLDDPDPALFDFIAKQILELNEAENCSLFPVRFLVLFSETLGIQPLVKNTKASFFNLEDGLIEEHDSLHNKTDNGPHVNLIVAIISNDKTQEYNKTDREKALLIMMDYYKIHIPKIEGFETYQIVKEVLSE